MLLKPNHNYSTCKIDRQKANKQYFIRIKEKDTDINRKFQFWASAEISVILGRTYLPRTGTF